ncbi:DUF2207 domain-containing protein [Bifidobacterium oedipodis]|uniref:DUF2207 domain-containing protein n=1 Tax=Bifidobacterium oedipodis TaxID=2675322 RepID=A0A7Y0ESI8_9BIFI|nr:DUF2207 domain-containing protein [Bifidobacterium sp. DSM 109957]NMM95203.1 hypothetical protein [Bifidobacterium sp. DSM 109957]
MNKRFRNAGCWAICLTVSFTVITILMVLFAGSDADLSYRTLDYEVTATADGDLEVTQHIDMKLRQREDDDDNTRPWKQLYQQYTLDSSKLTDITDISITNVSDGQTYSQTEPQSPSDISDNDWNTNYANHWYIADVSAGDWDPKPYKPGKDGLEPSNNTNNNAADITTKTIEIGWNIPPTVSADSLRFDISFTMHDVITKWNDIATFQWEPFGVTNQVPIGKVTGTIRFPQSLGTDKSWAWLHNERTSSIKRDTNGGFTFTAYDITAGDYLDVVAAFDASAAGDMTFTKSGNHLDALISDETSQEQQWQQRQRTEAIISVIVWIVTILIGVALCAWGIRAVMRTNREAHYHGPIEYYRGQPGISPASAAIMMNIVEPEAESVGDCQLTATILSLAVKKAIAIYPGPASLYRGIDMSTAAPAGIAGMIGTDAGRVDEARTTNTIVILPRAIDGMPNAEQLQLSQSEEAMLNLLIAISQRVGCPVFDLHQMNDACKDWEEGYTTLGKFTEACTSEFGMLGAARSVMSRYLTPGLLAVLLGVISIIVNVERGHAVAGFIIGIPFFFVGWFIALAGTSPIITATGQDVARRCLGLKRYMQDCSDLSRCDAADMALWDWYMVYAAAFGISERVQRELVKAYPQITDPNWLDTYASGMLLYWAYRPYSWYGHHYAHYAHGSGVEDLDGAMNGLNGAQSVFDGDSFSVGFNDLSTQLSAGFADITATIQAAAPSSSGGGGGGGFGGSSGGSGGGSFGGR